MKIAFFVNDLAGESAGYTTTRLAHTAAVRDHEVWYISADDFVYSPDGQLRANAWGPGEVGDQDETGATFLERVRGKAGVREQIDVADLDILMLRSDPATDAVQRPWAEHAGLRFGKLAAARGVLVLNDPTGLASAVDKLYLELFPEDVRPRTLITRSADDIRAFAKQEGSVVLKPLKGSGGESVFLIKKNDHSNLNQIIDAVCRFGYVIAQEYMPDASERDTRFFLMNGRPLMVDDQYAAFQRVGASDDVRTNVSAGGKVAKVEITDRMLEMAEMVRPRLVNDGMFLVGLDMAGDRLMEINVFSPGGLGVATRLNGKDFAGAVVDEFERKVEHMARYGQDMPNAQMATL